MSIKVPTLLYGNIETIIQSNFSVFINFLYYRIFPAIRRGFRPSRMTSNNLISPMKFCYNTNSTLPKQCQSSLSVLQDGSRTFGLFWKEKTRLITEEIRYISINDPPVNNVAKTNQPKVNICCDFQFSRFISADNIERS